MMYDHVLTFTDEVSTLVLIVALLVNTEFCIKVQYIWKAKKTPVVFMFLLVSVYAPSAGLWGLRSILFRIATLLLLS